MQRGHHRGSLRVKKRGSQPLGSWNELTLSKALAAPLLVWFGMAAMLSLIVLVATSVWRRPLRLSYEVWHAIHAVLAVILVVGAVGHIIFVDEYVGSLWKQVLWALMSGPSSACWCGCA